MDGEIIIALIFNLKMKGAYEPKPETVDNLWIEKSPQSVSFKLTPSTLRIVRQQIQKKLNSLSWSFSWFRFVINSARCCLYTISQELHSQGLHDHIPFFLIFTSASEQLADWTINKLLDRRSVPVRWAKFINVARHPLSTLETDKVTASTDHSRQLYDQDNVDCFNWWQIEHFWRVCPFLQQNMPRTRNQVEVVISWITLNQENARAVSSKAFKEGSVRTWVWKIKMQITAIYVIYILF